MKMRIVVAKGRGLMDIRWMKEEHDDEEDRGITKWNASKTRQMV